MADKLIIKIDGDDSLLRNKIAELGKITSETMAAAASAASSVAANLISAFDEAQPKMVTIGKNIAQGIGSGLNSMSSSVKAQAASFARGITASIKNSLGIQSPSKVMRDEVGRMIAEGISLGVEDKEEDLVKVMERQRKAIVNSFSSMANDAAKAIQDLQSTQEKFAKGLIDYGKLYQIVDDTDVVLNKTYDWNEKKKIMRVTTEYDQKAELADITQHTDSLNSYVNALISLKERENTPKAFFENLRELSVDEGRRFAEALLALDDDMYHDYMAAWEEKQNTANEIAKLLYQDDTQNLINSINEKFAELPDEMFESGADSAKNFGAGFIVEFLKTMDTVRFYLDDMMSSSFPQTLYPASNNGIVNNYNSMSSQYYLTSSNESIHSQINALENARDIASLRGY